MADAGFRARYIYVYSIAERAPILIYCLSCDIAIFALFMGNITATAFTHMKI